MIIKALILFSLSNEMPSDSTVNKTSLLNEVVISANRSESQEFYTPNSVKILTKKYLQSYTPRTTPEALLGVNGVFVQKTNHGGGSPFVRGLTGNQTLLLVDGIRLNNSTFRYGPNQYLTTIDPFSIEKIEVLKGGGSVQYGSDALGGTIQILTTEPEFDNKLKINLLGRFATQAMEKTARGEISFGGKIMAILGSFNLRNFGDLVGGKQTGKQSPSGYDEKAGNLKAKFKIGKGILTASHQYYEAQNVPVYHKVVLENFALNEFQPQRRNLSYLKFLQKNESKIFNEISITTSLQGTYEGRNSKKNGVNKLIEETDQVLTKGFTTNIHSEINENWSVNSGLEIYHDLVKSQKVEISGSTISAKSRGLYPDNSSFLNYSVYSLHQFSIKNWQFSAGLRYNGFSITIPDETIGESQIQPKALVGNTSILYDFNEKSVLYLSYNSGFRSPNIDDLGTLGIVDFRYELPTQNLKPEKSKNFELGYKLRINHFSSAISLYYSQLRDIITRVKVPNQVINGYQVYKKENSEKGFIRGAEWEFEAILTKKIKSYGGFSYTFGQNLSKNEPMRRIPPLNGRFGINFQEKKFFIRPELLFAGKQTRLAQGDKDDNRIDKNGTAAWQIINLQSGFTHKWLTINLLFQNLTNKDYRTHGSGINGVGRSALLSLNFSL